jgi:transposase
MARSHARTKAGQRAVAKKPAAKGKNITVIGALGVTGLVGVHSLVGGMKKPDFVAYLRNHLFPLMRRGQALVMDNLRSHHSKEVRALADEFGIQLIFTPPYSPEMNPIEEAWSKLKNCLRSMAARTATKVMGAVQAAALAITPKDVLGWVRHAGYPI